MDELLGQLMEGVARWRAGEIEAYWLHAGYIGGDLDRFGEHDLADVAGELWHSKDGSPWNKLSQGSIYWVFSVPGTFVWARDILTKVLPQHDVGPEAVDLRLNDDYGYVEFLRARIAKRAADNFTLEVKEFGLGDHPGREA